MNEQTNVEKVQALYQAFGAGQIQTVLEALDEEVEWFTPGPNHLPFAGVRRGPQEVAGFFQALAENVEFESFEPQEYIAQNDTVVALGKDTGRARATGRPVHNDWAMVWKFRAGKVIRFHIYEDTAHNLEAFQP